ncbi:MAG: bleomycin resistance protein [Flavipsychrobacter sp.]|nr:bleomycin resistance protein [Flavipsychrobacter sp.]
MINMRVEDLEWLLGELKKEGVEQIGELQVYDYGKFAHIMDPEGNKIELWEAIEYDFGAADEVANADQP